MAVSPDLKSLETQNKLYFQVLIDYIDIEKGETTGVNRELETGALRTFDEASNLAMEAANRFLSSVPGTSLVEIDPDQQTDEFHIFVVDTKNDMIVAKLGIVATDYAKVTIH